MRTEVVETRVLGRGVLSRLGLRPSDCRDQRFNWKIDQTAKSLFFPFRRALPSRYLVVSRRLGFQHLIQVAPDGSEVRLSFVPLKQVGTYKVAYAFPVPTTASHVLCSSLHWRQETHYRKKGTCDLPGPPTTWPSTIQRVF